MTVSDYFIDPKKLRRFAPLAPLCAFSDVGYMLHNATASKIRTEALHEAHKHHEVIRLGPNRLSFSSVGAIKDIYGTGTSCIKGDAPYRTAGGTPNILTVIDKTWHSTKRKRLSAAFSTKQLLAWEAKVADKVERLLAQFDVRATALASSSARISFDANTVNFYAWSKLFTFEAIGDIALGHQFGFLEAGTDNILVASNNGNRQVVKAGECLYAVNRCLEPIIWSASWHSTLKHLTKVLPRYSGWWKHAMSWPRIVRHLVRERIQKEKRGEKIDDIFASLLNGSDGKPLGLDEDEILAETSHLLDAGLATTAVALTQVMHCLAKQPTALKKLRAEVDGAVEDTSSGPMYSQVRSLPYLRACLDEAMRLRPALTAGQQRETPPEGMTIAGEWVPGGVFVSVPAYVAHRDPVVFPEPEEFRPERWLGESGKLSQRYSLTFSQGGRVCIGKNITYIEQTMLVAAMVRRYNFVLPYEPWEVEWEEYFNLYPKSLPLRLSRRCYT
ncbi:hypothetical protein LTR53_000079 [Teratosphaeriaceae sp. CCFEE 6253]|nr:hypothetical protein LTR53_000079 [Teratosphaeriaceae sp. CCFEE 6253]